MLSFAPPYLAGSPFRARAVRTMIRCILFGVTLASVPGRGMSQSIASAERPSSPFENPREVASSLEHDDAAAIAQIMARPLFVSGRRPPAVAATLSPTVVVEVPKRPWDWRLAGIMVSPEKREALFIRDDLKLAVAQGEDIDGWTLVAVAADNVQIESDGSKKSLRPEPDPAAVGQLVAGNTKKLLPKPSLALPSPQQTRATFLAVAKKSMEEEMKKPKRQLRPHAP